MAQLSRRLWGGTSLKTAAKEAISRTDWNVNGNLLQGYHFWSSVISVQSRLDTNWSRFETSPQAIRYTKKVDSIIVSNYDSFMFFLFLYVPTDAAQQFLYVLNYLVVRTAQNLQYR